MIRRNKPYLPSHDILPGIYLDNWAQSDDECQKGGNNILGNCNGRDISVMINSDT